jgi:signal recognition particle subunit SRP54
MYEQFQNIMRMGPLSQVLSMIPGLPQNMGGQDKAGAERLKKFCTMMDSMTDAELDSQKALDIVNSMEARMRVIRIAKGCGCHPQEVVQLLDEHKRFSKMVGKMGKLGKGKYV